MAADITNTILDKLVEILTFELQTQVDPADPLRLNLVDRYPFQQDPTDPTVAPFIWVSPDLERGAIPDPLHTEEIGEGVNWFRFFHIRGRIPQQFDKDTAYRLIGEFNQRTIRALRKHWDLAGLTADDGEAVHYCSPRFIGQNLIKVFGGENEWFGEFRITCHFPTAEPSDWWDWPA